MKETRVLDYSADPAAAVDEAAAILKTGGLVAFPTETVYGLGARGLHTPSLGKVFEAKGRPRSDPLILHVSEEGWLDELTAEVPEVARLLARRFWPGPLTLVLRKSARVPDLATAGLPSVAVRMPAPPVALRLLEAVGEPVAAPSANPFGRPSPTTARHVLADLAGKIDAVLDGGPTTVGIESTVVDCRDGRPRVLRPGGITREQMERALDYEIATNLDLDAPGGAAALVSPGTLTRHYSPRARVRLFVIDTPLMPPRLLSEIESASETGSVGVLAFDEDLSSLDGLPVTIESVGPRAHPEQCARRLFAAIRSLDEAGVEIVFVRSAPPGGMGAAINDRLRRAAAGRVESMR